MSKQTLKSLQNDYIPQLDYYLSFATRFGFQVCSLRQYVYGPPISAGRLCFFRTSLVLFWALLARALVLVLVNRPLYLDLLGDYLRLFGRTRLLVHAGMFSLQLNNVFFAQIVWPKFWTQNAQFIYPLLPFCDQSYALHHSSGLSLKEHTRYKRSIRRYVDYVKYAMAGLMSILTLNGYFVLLNFQCCWIDVLRLFWLVVNTFDYCWPLGCIFLACSYFFFSYTLINAHLRDFRLQLHLTSSSSRHLVLTWQQIFQIRRQINVRMIEINNAMKAFDFQTGEALYSVSLFNNVTFYCALFIADTIWMRIFFLMVNVPAVFMLFFLVSRGCIINKKWDLLPDQLRPLLNRVHRSPAKKLKLLVEIENCTKNDLIGMKPFNTTKLRYYEYFQFVLGNISFFLLIRSLAVSNQSQV